MVFGGVIAKFLLNIWFDWADENTPTNITSSQTMKRQCPTCKKACFVKID